MKLDSLLEAGIVPVTALDPAARVLVLASRGPVFSSGHDLSEGRSHVCTLRPAPFKEVSELVEHYRVFWEQALHRLEAYIRETEGEEKKHGHKERR